MPELQPTVRSDAGAQIRDGVKSVAKAGVCPETEWPYDDTHPTTEDGPWPPPTTSCRTSG